MAAYDMPTEKIMRVVDMRKEFADKPESVGKESGRFIKVGHTYMHNPSFKEAE